MRIVFRRPARRPSPHAGVTMALACAVAAAGRWAGAANEVPAAEAFFESQVRPLLVDRCQSCHGPEKAEAGLRLDSRPGVLAGGDNGAVVVAGDVAASRLLAAVRRSGDLAMPPDEPLTAAEVTVLERWVADGLPWSGPGADGPAAPGRPDAAARLAAAGATHWAFIPPRRHAPPEIPATFPPAQSAGWSGHAIDRFVAAGIAAAGIGPAPQAAPHDLVRRLWFDLTGLPPPADEVDAFCQDQSDSAYAALVERLLATPDHAEHWARKWLDLARYADTAGYALDGQDARYPHAWTYRDWVVRTLHEDVPYDRFVTLQLAADLLEPPVPPADLAALGFLTVGRSFLGNQHDIIDDRIDLVSRGLMGLTVACARCHDHLYEPVSMADYYALHGIFASSRSPDPLPVIGPSPPGAEAEAFARRHAELTALIPAHEAAVHARAAREAIAHAADYLFEVLRPTPRGADKRPPRLADGYELEQLLLDRLARALTADPADPLLGPWAALAAVPDADFGAAVPRALAAWQAALPNPVLRRELERSPPATARELADAYGRLVTRAAAAQGKPDDSADLEVIRARFTTPGAPFVVLPSEAMRVANRDEQTKLRKLRRSLTKHEAEAAGGPPRAMTLEDVAEPVDSRILLRGNAGRPGDAVPRRMPAVLGGAAVPGAASGRLELARCIVDPRNPLTPRVIVNWVWLHHFGAGLVATPGDLGLRGTPPTHPELLDDLASRFTTEGRWSLRWLHREIVTSRTWRQSATVRPEVATADPDNLLLTRANRRRLDWEAWRDALLATAGSLDPARRGGRGVDPLAPAAMHARSLYAFVDRQDVPGILRVFDVADPDVAVHARTRTSVPQRALAMLNSPLVVEAARRLAERASSGATDDTAFVGRLWRLALSRDPDHEERAAGLDFLAATAEPPPAADATAATFGPRARLAQAVLASAEFEFID